MRRNCIASLAVVVVLSGLWSAPLRAQQSFTFEFRPVVGSFVRWMYDTQGEMLFTGFPLLPDSSIAEVQARIGLTRRIMERMDRTYEALVTVDSAVARYRVTGRDWRPIAQARDPVGPAQFLVDDMAAASPVSHPGEENEIDAFLGVLGAIQIAFPPGPVATGDQWAADASYPYTTEIFADSSVIITVTLAGEGTATLDSVVVREADTLAFVTASGAFQPVFTEAPHPSDGSATVVEIWGSHASALLWSTGWQTWVSGATTVRIHERIEAPAGSGATDARVRADLSTRFRVIP